MGKPSQSPKFPIIDFPLGNIVVREKDLLNKNRFFRGGFLFHLNYSLT